MTDKQLLQKINKHLEDGTSIRTIATRLGVTRYKVSRLITEQSERPLDSSSNFSKIVEMRSEIVQWLEEKKLTAILIHKRILERGVDVSYSTVVRFLKTLQKKEVYVPVITAPGEEAQVDFGYFGLFNKEGKKVKVWVFNMVLSFSRYAFYKIVTDQSIATFLNCHANAFEFFKGVPASIKIDNLGAGVLEADFYEPAIQSRYTDFLDHYGTTVITARICRGQDKGKVEAGIKYVKYNFLKSLTHREFSLLPNELAAWTKNVCNLRVHGTTHKIPLDRYLKIEKAVLLALPEEKYKLIETEERKVNSYGHVYFRKNYYSVPHHYAGETVLLQCNSTTLKIYKDERLLAIHAVAIDTGQYITVENHKPFHKQKKTENYYLEQTALIGEHATRLLQLMQAERPFHWKQMIKGICALMKVYAPVLVNQACELTINSNEHTYKKVRQQCEKMHNNREAAPKVIKGVNGYFHDLSIYDQLVNRR